MSSIVSMARNGRPVPKQTQKLVPIDEADWDKWFTDEPFRHVPIHQELDPATFDNSKRWDVILTPIKHTGPIDIGIVCGLLAFYAKYLSQRKQVVRFGELVTEIPRSPTNITCPELKTAKELYNSLYNAFGIPMKGMYIFLDVARTPYDQKKLVFIAGYINPFRVSYQVTIDVEECTFTWGAVEN